MGLHFSRVFLNFMQFSPKGCTGVAPKKQETMASEKISLTKTVIEATPAPSSGRVFLHDKNIPGLAVQITPTGSRSFQLIKKVRGKVVRVTLGRYPAMTVEQAKKAAQRALADMVTGTNPNTVKKKERARGMTLKEVAEDYLATRELKPSTQKDIDRCLSETFADWLKKPMTEITADMVMSRHRKRMDQSKARANTAMRWLRALWNHARARYRDDQGQPILGENPVRVLTERKQWARVQRKQTMIPHHQLAPWWTAVQSIEDTYRRDFFTTLLLTGLRKSEAQGLRWGDVDLVAMTLKFRGTKNHNDHTLPMGRWLFDRFKAMHQARTEGAEFVFASGAEPITDHLCRHARDQVCQAVGIHFTPHDLRRTFATIAESLDISQLTIKRLLNHVTTSEVTGGYIVFTTDRLRDPMQRIEDFILKSAGVLPTASVSSIRIHNETH